MQNLTVQKLCIGLVCLAFFVAAPLLTGEFLEGNTLPVFLLLALGVLLLLLFVLKDRCWLIIPFCLPIEGRLNFLPLNFSMQEISVLYVLAYVLLQIVMGKDIPWRLGPARLWIPLAGLVGILLYHWIRSGDIGIRALGGTGWGGRYYFTILLLVLSIPLLNSFSGSSWQDFQKIPLLYLLGTLVDLIPNTFTTLVPAAAPYIFRFYSSVNITEYGKELAGAFTSGEGVTRFRTFAALGSALTLALLCYFPFQTWLRPERLFIPPMMILALLASAFSGFRSAIFNFAVVSFFGLFATARFKTFFLFPFGAVVIGVVCLTQGRIINYPQSIQRALTFLPGDWDLVAAKDAESSSKWRQDIRELFFAEYFRQAPLLGQGYHFDPIHSLREQDIYLRMAVMQTSDPYQGVRPFIERRQPHEGDIHALLATGILGLVFFVLFCLAAFGEALRWVMRTPRPLIAPVQVWLLALIALQGASFFAVYGDLANTLAVLCPLVGLLGASERIRPQFQDAYGPEPSLDTKPPYFESWQGERSST